MIVEKKNRIRLTSSMVPKEFEGNVKDKPKFLELLVGRSERKAKYVKLAEALKALPHGKCLAYTVPQFEEVLGAFKGKATVTNIVQTMKRFDLPKARMVMDNGVIYIWSNGHEEE